MLKKAEKPENAQPAAKRKLTRAERKQIGAIIRQAKGDGKPHTVQDSIPFWNLYPDGLCRLDAQGDALDDMRMEASGILQIQYERGNNGFVKRKYFSRFVVGLSAFWQETLYFGKFFRNTENSNTKKENARTIQIGKCGHFLFVRSCLELD